MFSVLSTLAFALSVPQPTFPKEYYCKHSWVLNGSHYEQTEYVDRTNNREAIVSHTAGHTQVSFGHNASSYSITANDCRHDHLYTKLTNDPALTPAYKYIGEQTVGTEKCDVFGEQDQWAHHAVYFKHGSWEAVQIVDKEQEKAGMLKGTVHYSCKEGAGSEHVYQLPRRCYE